MAWIETPDGEHEAGADPAEAQRLRAVRARARDPRSGRVDHILAVHGLHPAGMEAHLALYTAVMRGTPTLPRVERELVAFVVSRLNGCEY